MNKQCNWVGLVSGRCSLPAVWMVLAGCVHEHLLEVAACEWHTEAVRDGRVWCAKCDAVDVRVRKVYVSRRRLGEPEPQQARVGGTE